MRRPTCTGPSPETTTSDSGRWVCDGIEPVPFARQLAHRIAEVRDLDALLEAFVAIEHARIHCRIDSDDYTVLVEMHRRTYRRLMARALRDSPRGRSVTMLVRSVGAA